MKKLLIVLILSIGTSQVNAQDWVMESVEHISQRDSLSGKAYIEVRFRVVPEWKHQQPDQLENTRIFVQNFSLDLFITTYRNQQSSGSPHDGLSFKVRDKERIEEFKKCPLETEYYNNPLGYVGNDKGVYNK